MKILSKDDILDNKEFYINEILNNKIFVYPTDTLYGIGCLAVSDESVLRIFEIKNRCKKPLLVIVPDLNWIEDNLVCDKDDIKFMKEKFETQHSFVLELKNKKVISKYVNNDMNTIGIRYPNCWFRKIIEELGLPFVTTSVNLSGEESAVKFEDIDERIIERVDYVIVDDENMTGNSSKIISLVERKVLRN